MSYGVILSAEMQRKKPEAEIVLGLRFHVD
jgi:hypothetical protein